MALEQTALRPTEPRRLRVPLRKQQASEWCWAAVSQAVELFYDPASDLQQCRIVGNAFHRACCGKGDAPTPDPVCNRPGYLHEVLDGLGLLVKSSEDPRSGAITGPVSFDQLCREIDHGRPVCVLIKWRGGGGRGHFILIEGYSVSATRTPYVFVRNPMSPRSSSHHPYRVLASQGADGGYQDGQGVWAYSFLVRPRGGKA
jgi:hypothetical protein